MDYLVSVVAVQVAEVHRMITTQLVSLRSLYFWPSKIKVSRCEDHLKTNCSTTTLGFIDIVQIWDVMAIPNPLG